MARDLKIEKVRTMDADEMAAKVKSIDEELFNLRFRNAMKQLENPLEIRNLRKDLARLKTVLRQQQLEEAAAAAKLSAEAKKAAGKGGAL